MADYDIRAYGAMQADPVRMDAYYAALRATVRPGCVVLDLGSGTGILALKAVQLGARRVIAVETSPLIEIGRRCAVASGMADRIQFVHGDSRALVLDEPVDVVVADLRGALPLLDDGPAVLRDAYTRLLRPGGVMIPLRDTLLAAPVCAPAEHRWITAGWESPGLDLSPGREASLSDWGRLGTAGVELLAPGEAWATMQPGDGRPAGGDAHFTIERDGTCHGLAAWFNAELAPGISFSTAPDQPRTVYGQAFFPWPEPLALRQGDRVLAEFGIHHPGSSAIWVWKSRVEREGTVVASFRQPRVLPALGSVAAIRRRAESHRPAWTELGRAARATLDGAAAGDTLGAIADRLHLDFPETFARRADALNYAADLMERAGG